MNDRLPCDACGRLWPIDLLDGKAEPDTDPETTDWTRLEGPCCYGSGWLPLADSWAAGVRQGLRVFVWRTRHRLTAIFDRSAKRSAALGLERGR